jgi:hypothetical protein
MRRLHPAIDGLVSELNGESILSTTDRLSKAAVTRLRQLCADLEELERIRAELEQREPQAFDPVSTAERSWAWPNLQLKNPISQELSATGKQILERVNAQFNRLRTRVGVILAADARGLRLGRWEFEEDKRFYATFLLFVLELLASGELQRLHRCLRKECGRWFFAQTNWQKYCSRNCRQMVAAQGETFKETRRLYMHKRRRDEKEREMRERQVGKKGRQK